MMNALSIPKSRAFDGQTIDLPQLTMPLRLTWEAMLGYKLEADTLAEYIQANTRELLSYEVMWNDLLNANRIVVQVLAEPIHYKTLRKAKDYAQSQLDVACSVKATSKKMHSRSRLFAVADFFLAKRLRVENNRLYKAAQSNLRKINHLLAMVEPTDSVSTVTGFRNVSPDELWDGRCKAYEYSL